MPFKRISTKEKTIYSVPDLPPLAVTPVRCRGLPKCDCGFPHAKYIVVWKILEKKKTYYCKGLPLRVMAYGVGILTDDNDYYYSELYFRQATISKNQADKLKMVFLTRYHVDSSTKMLISDSIDFRREAVGIFLDIVSCVSNCRTIKTDQLHVMRRINNEYQFIWDKRGRKLNKWYKTRIYDAIVEKLDFPFIVEPGWRENLSTLTSYSKFGRLMCAMGVVYMFLVDESRKILKRWRERHGQLTKIEAYNLNRQREQEEGIENEAE